MIRLWVVRAFSCAASCAASRFTASTPDARTTVDWIMIRLWVVRAPGSVPEMPAPLLTGS